MYTELHLTYSYSVILIHYIILASQLPDISVFNEIHDYLPLHCPAEGGVNMPPDVITQGQRFSQGCFENMKSIKATS